MNGDISNNNNPPQNDRVSEDAAKSLQNILNSVRTSVENEFAIQQMEYEEIYGVDSAEYEDYLNKVGNWLRANKLIDMVMDLLPISLMMDMATSQDSPPEPDPNISPTLPSMPIPSAAQQMAASQEQVQTPVQAQAQTPEPVQGQAAPQALPSNQNAPDSSPWAAPPEAVQNPNSEFSQISSESIQAIPNPQEVLPTPTTNPVPQQQSSNIAGTPELDSIFPASQQPQQPVPQQEVQEEPQASAHEMAAQKSAYIPNNAWQTSDPQMKAPSMPMPPPPPPKPDDQSNAVGADIPDNQFESAEIDVPIQAEVQEQDSVGDQGVPPPMPPVPPKMPPPPPPKTQAPPSVPFMPPSPPPKNASSIPEESIDLFDELRQSQAAEATETEETSDGFQSGTWANQAQQEQQNASDVLNAPVEPQQAQAPATGWEQVESDQPDANTWDPPAGENHPQPPPPPPLPQQPAANTWESPQAEAPPQPDANNGNAWGPPQGQVESQPQPDASWGPPQGQVESQPQPPAPPPQPQVQPQPQQQPQQPVQANPWGEPQPQQPGQNAWGEQPQVQPQPQPQQQPQQPPAPPQNGQNGEPKTEEKEGDSFVFDPTTAWG